MVSFFFASLPQPNPSKKKSHHFPLIYFAHTHKRTPTSHFDAYGMHKGFSPHKNGYRNSATGSALCSSIPIDDDADSHRHKRVFLALSCVSLVFGARNALTTDTNVRTHVRVSTTISGWRPANTHIPLLPDNYPPQQFHRTHRSTQRKSGRCAQHSHRSSSIERYGLGCVSFMSRWLSPLSTVVGANVCP